MADVSLNQYDLYYINAASPAVKMGFMLAKGRNRTKLWRRTDERPLPDSYATGDISYANLSPDIQKIIAQRLLHAGFGASEHEVEEDTDFYALRYLRSQNIDNRCRGKAYPGPKIVELTLPTVTTAVLIDGGMELDTGWTSGTRSLTQAHSGTYSRRVLSTDTAYQDIESGGGFLAEWRGRVFEITGWIYDESAAGNEASIQIDDGVGTTDSAKAGVQSTWTKVTIRVQLDSSATQFRINLMNPAGAQAYFDDVSISEQPTVGSVSVFADFNNEHFATYGNILAKMNAGKTGYDYVYSFPATITDLKVFRVSGVDYLYVAIGDSDKLWYGGRLVENCEDAWDELVDTDVTSTADTTDKVVGLASVKLEVAAGCAAGDILATEVITSLDLTSYSSLNLYIKSSVALDAGDLQLLLDDTAKCASPIKSLNIPAITADTWTLISLDLGDASGLGAVISIGLKMVVDKGAFTVRVDQIMADFIEAASEQAYHLESTTSTLYAIKQAGGNKLRKTTAVDTWSDIDYVGAASDNHNDLVNLAGVIWIMKEDGAYYLDSAGAIQNPFPELATIRHADAGKNSTVFRNRLYFRMGEQQEWEIDGTDLTEVTPANFAPDISQYAYPCVARAGDESWLYALMKAQQTNLLTNVGFETGDPPDDWTVGGTGATWVRSNAQAHGGTYSGKLTRSGADCIAYQAVSDYTPYKGKTVTFSCWVYATVANRARIALYDGGGMASYSSYHTGAAGWELLTVTRTIDAAATQLKPKGELNLGDTSAYFDDAVLIEGASENAVEMPILAGRWEYIAGKTRWIWHHIASAYLTDVACAFVSSAEGRPYLYLGSTDSSDKVYKVYLPVTNDATADAGYRFCLAGSLWSPRYMTLLFAVDKRWLELYLRSQNLTATNYINAYYSTDDGATFTLLKKMATSPEQTEEFTNIEATMMNLRLDFVGDSDTVPPVLKYYILKALTLMPSVVRFNHTIKCADNLLLKGNLQSDTSLSTIAAFINGIRDEICTLGDVDGNEHTVKVRVENDYETIDLETNRPIRQYDIQAIKL